MYLSSGRCNRTVKQRARTPNAARFHSLHAFRRTLSVCQEQLPRKSGVRQSLQLERNINHCDMSEVTDIKEAEKIAQSEGGPKQDRASAMREKEWSSDKMENELEMQKANKTKAQSADEIGGRKGKGSGTSFLQKITPDPNKKKTVVAD